ncbi:unnamed protein product [Heterobilharzia americana]|nr:unnamed protein product [Heterobilharzia americana]
MFCNENSLGNSPITGGLIPNFMGSSTDRTLNNCPTICSNITSSLCNTSSMSSNNPVGNVTTNLSNTNIVLGSLYSTDSSLQVSSNEPPLIGNLGISNIEGIPANVLLSLLHQQTQSLQRKIYIKLENNIFVGAAFNLSPSDTEGVGLREDNNDCTTKSCDDESLRKTVHTTMISFTVGFLMDSSAPPSVLSYLTELSRLIGSQIRRAELMFNYLRDQRDIITSTLEKYSYADANTSTDHITNRYGSDNFSTPRFNQSLPNKRHMKLSEVVNSERENNLSNPAVDHNFNENQLTPQAGVNQPPNENAVTNHINDNDSNDKWNETVTMNPLERLVQISSLCSELKCILDSICKTGHVNVKINKIYPVCFCLPHKAYCLNNNNIGGISKCMIAVRPMAIWRAMDKIRPYHALILLLRKSDLLKDYLPTDINPTLNNFINALSPTTSLYNLAERIHSQTHCLNLALWLIYRGHALIVYPIVANNIYVLSPHSKAWFTPQLIGQFATSFPEVNFAELLTSFSTSFILRDHFHSSTTVSDNLHFDGDLANSPNAVRNRSSKTSWTNLPLAQKINLIAWLLRRRLIIQIHLYIFPTFLSSEVVNGMIFSLQNVNDNSMTHCSSSSDYDSEEITLEHKNNGITKDLCIDDAVLDFDELCKKIPKDILHELSENLPVESRQTLLQSILSHPGATQNIQLLKLFARILPHLPAHIEEIMFKEQIKRSTLIECVERFAPFLATARLPDPVTSCFAGIPWPN